MKSQRTSPDVNADLDCVPTGIASALQYETGREFEPNQVKDAVYGQDFVGGKIPTVASRFIEDSPQVKASEQRQNITAQNER